MSGGDPTPASLETLLDAVTAAGPAAATSGKKKDIFEGWDNVPLFMKSLDASGNGTDENPALEALQSLMYEGTPSEIAATLKDTANEYYRGKQFKQAHQFYSQALEQDLPWAEKQVLWSNRAAASFELKNFGSCLRDLALVLSPEPEKEEEVIELSAGGTTELPSPREAAAANQLRLKALYRSARALVELDKLVEALDALERFRVLEIEMGRAADDAMGKLQASVEEKLSLKEAKVKEREERETRKKELERRTKEALLARGLILPKLSKSTSLFSSCPTDIQPPHFDLSSLPTPSSFPSPTEDSLILPVFCLFPLEKPQPTRDLCLAFHELSTFAEELEAMDRKPSEFVLYASTAGGKVIKVGAKHTLAAVLKAASSAGTAGAEGGKKDGVELKEGWAVEMTVVPKGKEGEEWIEGWRKQLKEGKRGV